MFTLHLQGPKDVHWYSQNMPKPSLMILSFSPLVADARILKQISLFSSRYEITTVGHGPKPAGATHHFQVPDDVRAWWWDGKPLRLRAYSWAYWHNEGVAWVRRNVPRGTVDAIIANDLEAAGVALWLAPRNGVHADLHEYAPRQNDQYPKWNFWVRPFMEWMVRTYVRKAASVTTVGDHIAREYEAQFGLKNVGVVPNAAPYASSLRPTAVSRPLRLVHSGAARAERGLENHIDAVAGIEGVTLDLYLTQNTTDYFRELKLRASKTANVRVLDPVPYSELVSTLNTYDVGLYSLPPVNFNTTWAVPNKIYDFIQARLALIIGPSPEMAAVVDAHGLGIVASDFGVESLRAAIRSVTPGQVAMMKERSSKAAKPLSAEAQMAAWDTALSALLG